MEDIGRRIRKARKDAGLSQEALARRASMSLNGMASIERGEIVDPHYSTLVGLADALDMSVGELLDSPKVEAPTSSHREEDEERRSVVKNGIFGTLIDQYEPIRHQLPLFLELSTHGKQELFERVWSLREQVYSARDDLPSPGAAFLHDALTNAALFFIEAFLRERQQRSDEEEGVGTERQLEEEEFERRRAVIKAENTRRISA